jgi:hypothetical protein
MLSQRCSAAVVRSAENRGLVLAIDGVAVLVEEKEEEGEEQEKEEESLCSVGIFPVSGVTDRRSASEGPRQRFEGKEGGR